MILDFVNFSIFFILSISFYLLGIAWFLAFPMIYKLKFPNRCLTKLEIFLYFTTPILFSIVVSRNDWGSSIDKCFIFVGSFVVFFTLFGCEQLIKKMIK